MADDDVQLTDLEVIQRYSLAVRGATASRADLVRALQADLDWLRGGRRAATAASQPKAESQGTEKGPEKAPAKASVKAPVKAPAKAAKKAAAKAPAKRPAKA